jgi:hypothetical protein
VEVDDCPATQGQDSQFGERAPLDNRPEPRQLALEGDGSCVDARRRYRPQQWFGRQLMQADLHVDTEQDRHMMSQTSCPSDSAANPIRE